MLLDGENTLKILLATDTHLGYKEKDPLRDQDTFQTFEEILQIGAKEKVDFILLGGDLFHDCRPSQQCLLKCTELLRKYCLGDRPVEIEFLSDQSNNFQNSSNPVVNYEDPNLNVAIPVFSIHGNHDDPTGHKQISAMDIMASTGLLNYFGRWQSAKEVVINPILLQKGSTKMALYGLSHIRDERLGRLFLEKKVSMLTPENTEEFFHMLVWHQNRAERGQKNFIPDDNLPEFLDLVMWGHEHDCEIEPITMGNGVQITQPGSSVATSLSKGESIPKKIGILRVQGTKFHLEPIALKTVRPFEWDEMDLQNQDLEVSDELLSDEAVKKVRAKIEEMIVDSETIDNNMLPLIRLNVHCRNETQTFNTVRFGQQFSRRVANPEDMVKCLVQRRRRKKLNGEDPIEIDCEEKEDLSANVEALVEKHFLANPEELTCVPYKGFLQSITKFIQSNDQTAPKYYLEQFYEETFKKMWDNHETIDPENISKYLKKLKEERESSHQDVQDALRILNNPNRPRKANNAKQTIEDLVIDDLSDEEPATSSRTVPEPKRGRGRGRGAAAAKPTAGRGRKKVVF